jgi:hypothetical protein
LPSTRYATYAGSDSPAAIASALILFASAASVVAFSISSTPTTSGSRRTVRIIDEALFSLVPNAVAVSTASLANDVTPAAS